MTGLERRLARLEAATGVNSPYPTILVSFVHPGDTERPVRSIRINGRIYHRAACEPEDTFRARAMAEANEAERRPRGAHVGTDPRLATCSCRTVPLTRGV